VKSLFDLVAVFLINLPAVKPNKKKQRKAPERYGQMPKEKRI